MPIHDQGYEHWQGTLQDHRWRWLVVARHGVRVAMRNWFLRLIIVASWFPSLGLAAVLCLWGMVENQATSASKTLRSFEPLRELLNDPVQYRRTAWTVSFHIFIMVEMYITMFLVMLVGPGLISRDLRFNALPLYFSRPIRRIDYFLGKLGTIGWFLFLVTVVPAVIAWIFGVLLSMDPTVIVDTFRLLLALIVYGLIVTVSAGLLMLALSSLTHKSSYVVMMWAGFWLATSAVSTILENIHRHQVIRSHVMESSRMTELQGELREIDRQLYNRPTPNDPNLPRRGRLDPAALEQLTQRRLETRLELERLGSQTVSAGQQEYAQMQRTDWRPLLSYTENLQRLGFALINSRAAWEKVDKIRDERLRPIKHPDEIDYPSTYYADSLAPPYPWYWSAGVLLALGVLSVWILNQRVKCLDRLR